MNSGIHNNGSSIGFNGLFGNSSYFKFGIKSSIIIETYIEFAHFLKSCNATISKVSYQSTIEIGKMGSLKTDHHFSVGQEKIEIVLHHSIANYGIETDTENVTINLDGNHNRIPRKFFKYKNLALAIELKDNFLESQMLQSINVGDLSLFRKTLEQGYKPHLKGDLTFGPLGEVIAHSSAVNGRPMRNLIDAKITHEMMRILMYECKVEINFDLERFAGSCTVMLDTKPVINKIEKLIADFHSDKAITWLFRCKIVEGSIFSQIPTDIIKYIALMILK